jgi:hypothetical protein
MNKRIRELAAQAGIDPESDTLCRYEGWSEPIENFAELIIKDCLSIADNRGAYQVMDDIIERFGVEL